MCFKHTKKKFTINPFAFLSILLVNYFVINIYESGNALEIYSGYELYYINVRNLGINCRWRIRHSLFKLSTGFANAAFSDCQLTVTKAMTTAARPDAASTPMLMLVR